MTRKDLPADFEQRVYKLDGFKHMDNMKKYGLEPAITKEDLEDQIWDIGFKNYDTSMRRKQASELMRKSRIKDEIERNKTEEQKLAEEIQRQQEENRKEDERFAREREEEEKKHKEEEERKRRLKKRVDDYSVCLEVVKYVSGPVDQDVMVHVERVLEKEPMDNYVVLSVPWNKLSTKNEIEVIFSIVKNGVEVREPVMINVMKHVLTFSLQKVAKVDIKAVVSI